MADLQCCGQPLRYGDMVELLNQYWNRASNRGLRTYNVESNLTREPASNSLVLLAPGRSSSLMMHSHSYPTHTTRTVNQKHDDGSTLDRNVSERKSRCLFEALVRPAYGLHVCLGPLGVKVVGGDVEDVALNDPIATRVPRSRRPSATDSA